MRLASLALALAATFLVSSVALIGAFLLVHSAFANPATVSLSADPGAITPNETSIVTLTVIPASGEFVGFFHANITYEESQLTVMACTPIATCNTAFAAGTVAIVADTLALGGLSGAQGTVTFAPAAGFMGTASVGVDVTECDDVNADPITCTGTGTSTTVAVATPTSAPTMPPTQVPTQTPCSGSWTTSSLDTGVPFFGQGLQGVGGVASDDVWAVGWFGNDSTPSALIEHWDGAQWSRVVGPPPSLPDIAGHIQLNGVAAVAAGDVWAVGFSSSYGLHPATEQTLIEHWDGNNWSVFPSPNPGSGGNSLSAVTAISTNDVWAVGRSYNDSSYPRETLILHWDGHNWAVIPSPSPTPSISNGSFTNLLSVSGTSASDVWAVGLYADGGLFMHWDGLSWSIATPPVPDYDASSVLAISTTDVWAAGGGVWHWDGNTWTQFQSSFYVSALAGSAANDIWAAGTDNTAASSTPFSSHWNGSSWTDLPIASPDGYITGAASASGEIFAVGFGLGQYQTTAALASYFCGEPPRPVETNLTADASAGAMTLQPANTTGFASRDEIVINPGGADEEYSVVNALGSLDLAAPLQFAHSSGEQVVRVATGIHAGDADCSGAVGVNDAISVLRRVTALTPYDHCVAAGNVQCNDAIDARDALDLLLSIAGLPPDVGNCPTVQP